MTDDTLQAARESFSGRNRTETQVQQSYAIAGILHAELHRSGSFIEPLTDYAHAFARNQKFDAMRGEKFIRDVYQARYGQTLNQTREALQAAEKALPESAHTRALVCAETVGELIQDAPTQPFYKAYDRAAVTLSAEFGITQNAAKAMMQDSFAEKHGKDLYAHGKRLEEAYHKPVREAEIAARRAEKLPSQGLSRSMT